MRIKTFELRDKHTFIAVLAIDMNEPANPKQDWLMNRCGYPLDGRPNILLTRLDANDRATNDPYAWGSRTWSVAHHFILEHWRELADGAVIDVEFILGETKICKVSEQACSS